MSRHVALLRAINVGGRTVITMRDLQAVFEAAGCTEVTTVIQTGNVLFEAPPRAVTAALGAVRRRLTKLTGGEHEIIVRSAREFATLVASDPFAGLTSGGDMKLYVAFLARKASSPLTLPWSSAAEALEAVGATDREVFLVSRRKRNGMFGFPNLPIESALGVKATTRNWTTVLRLADRLTD